MNHKLSTVALAGAVFFTGNALAQDATITIESWRNDDLALWQDKIIPAFEKGHFFLLTIHPFVSPKIYQYKHLQV